MYNFNYTHQYTISINCIDKLQTLNTLLKNNCVRVCDISHIALNIYIYIYTYIRKYLINFKQSSRHYSSFFILQQTKQFNARYKKNARWIFNNTTLLLCARWQICVEVFRTWMVWENIYIYGLDAAAHKLVFWEDTMRNLWANINECRAFVYIYIQIHVNRMRGPHTRALEGAKTLWSQVRAHTSV